MPRGSCAPWRSGCSMIRTPMAGSAATSRLCARRAWGPIRTSECSGWVILCQCLAFTHHAFTARCVDCERACSACVRVRARTVSSTTTAAVNCADRIWRRVPHLWAAVYEIPVEAWKRSQVGIDARRMRHRSQRPDRGSRRLFGTCAECLSSADLRRPDSRSPCVQVQGHNHLPGGGEGEERVSGGKLQAFCRRGAGTTRRSVSASGQPIKAVACTGGGARTPSAVP